MGNFIEIVVAMRVSIEIANLVLSLHEKIKRLETKKKPAKNLRTKSKK